MEFDGYCLLLSRVELLHFVSQRDVETASEGGKAITTRPHGYCCVDVFIILRDEKLVAKYLELKLFP